MSISKKKYALVIIDDYLKYTWDFFLHSKDEITQMIINDIKKIELEAKLHVRTKRLDNGTEI